MTLWVRRPLTLSNASTTFGGAIDGSGEADAAAGTETLTGDDLYTGATTINGGTLALSGTGSIGLQRRCRRRHLRYLGDHLGRLDQDALGTGNVALGAQTPTPSNASTTSGGRSTAAAG